MAGVDLWNRKGDIVMHGWHQKPKGALQILWERGWIVLKVGDPWSHYTSPGKTSDVGNLMEEMRLDLFMKKQHKLLHEHTQLQAMMGKDMGIIVDRSRKYHCELAGEGIECSSGLRKEWRLMLMRSPDFECSGD
jgi:hypothetical protein